MLVLASSVILGSESRGTRDHILLSQIRDSPNMEGQVPVYMSPRNRVAQLYPQALGYYQSQSYVTTDGLSASLSWNKAPIWGLRPDLYYCQTLAGFGLLPIPVFSYTLSARTTHRKHVSRDRYPHCWHFGCFLAMVAALTYRKYVTWPLLTVVWLTAGTKKTLLQYCWLRVYCGSCLAIDLYVIICSS
jgi:hypothetical protein